MLPGNNAPFRRVGSHSDRDPKIFIASSLLFPQNSDSALKPEQTFG
jgi:hypothetical protein